MPSKKSKWLNYVHGYMDSREITYDITFDGDTMVVIILEIKTPSPVGTEFYQTRVGRWDPECIPLKVFCKLLTKGWNG